jgi:nucleoside-diphosphate-sugar epimerase
MSKLLITGAFGLIGTNICKVLERDYPDVEITKVKGWNPYLEVRGVGVIDFDYIIHAAGYGQPQMFSKDKRQTILMNTQGTNELFSLLKEGGKFLFISTSEVYSGAPSPHKETDIGTTTPQHPRACYIESKRCGEAICMAYREQGYDVKIARLALAYGPGTKKGDTRVINQFIEQALTTGKIKMKDKGEARRTYCYVDDVVHMMLDILFKGKDCVYNVGGETNVTIDSLARAICTITDATLESGTESLQGAPDDVRLNMTKTLTEFPRKFVGLLEGLTSTIYYQKKLYGN